MTQMSDKLSNKAENSFLYLSAKPHRILLPLPSTPLPSAHQTVFFSPIAQQQSASHPTFVSTLHNFAQRRNGRILQIKRDVIDETYDGVTHLWFVSHPVILLVK